VKVDPDAVFLPYKLASRIATVAKFGGMPKSERRHCVPVVMDRGSGGAAHDLRGSCRR
jgi:hypothetical protein